MLHPFEFKNEPAFLEMISQLILNTVNDLHPELLQFKKATPNYEDMTTTDQLEATLDGNPLLRTFETVRQGVYNSGYLYNSDGTAYKPTKQQKGFLSPCFGWQEISEYFPQPETRLEYKNEEAVRQWYAQHDFQSNSFQQQQISGFVPSEAELKHKSPSALDLGFLDLPGPSSISQHAPPHMKDEGGYNYATRRFSNSIEEGYQMSPMQQAKKQPLMKVRPGDHIDRERISLKDMLNTRFDDCFNQQDPSHLMLPPPAMPSSSPARRMDPSTLPTMSSALSDPFIDHSPQYQPHAAAAISSSQRPSINQAPETPTPFPRSTRRRKHEEIDEGLHSSSSPPEDSEDEDYAPTGKKRQKTNTISTRASTRRKQKQTKKTPEY